MQRIEEAKKPQVVEEKPQSQLLSTEVREERIEEVQKPQVVDGLSFALIESEILNTQPL